MEASEPSTPSSQYTYLADGSTARNLLQMGQRNSGGSVTLVATAPGLIRIAHADGAVAVLIRDDDVGPLRWLELSIA
jgi:hypothetical protein